MARFNIPQDFLSRPTLRSTVTDLLNAFCDLLIPCFLGAFLGNTVETDEKFVRKFCAFAVRERQRVLGELFDRSCHRVMFAPTRRGFKL